MFQWLKSLFTSSPKPTVQTENVENVGNVFAELDASLAAYRRGADGRNGTAARIHAITSDSSTSRAKVGALWSLIHQTKDPKTAEDKWVTLNMPAVFVDAYRKNSERVSSALISAASSHVGGGDCPAVRLINKLYAPESANTEFMDEVSETVFLGAQAMPLTEAMVPYSYNPKQ